MSDFQDLLDELEARELAKAQAGATPLIVGGTEAELDDPYKDDLVFTDETFNKAIEGVAIPLIKSEMQANNSDLAKALAMMLSHDKETDSKLIQLTALVKSQGELLASFGNQGTGRQSLQKALPAVEQNAQITGEEFLAKALTAMEGHKITGYEYSVADVAVRKGVQVDPAIVKKVLSV